MNSEVKGFLLRKLIHFFSIGFPLAIYLFDKKTYLPIIAFFLGGFLTADYLRFEIKSFGKFFKKLFGDMIKKKEQKFLTGATWVCFSAFFVALLFPKEIAIISLLFMCLSDNIASIVGKIFGKIRIFKEKTLEGALSFFMVSFIITLFYKMPLINKIILSLLITLTEVFSGDIDDNLTVPLTSAILLFFVF